MIRQNTLPGLVPLEFNHLAASEIAALINKTRLPFQSELQLQEALRDLFEDYGLDFLREYSLDVRDRADFLIDSSIVVEVKVGSSANAVRQQLWRYAKHPEVTDLILVTTKSGHTEVAGEILGKSVYVVHLINSFF